ncbi:MAG: serpin family protein [Planctomycetes bacterium]|nr:serpin family protein [Planctomycetota bacterium]
MATYKTALLSMMVMSVGCTSLAAKTVETPMSTDARRVAHGNNCFALELYGKLQEQPGNLFFSPYSISTALAMTYAGASGRTQEQMAQALCFPTATTVAQSPSAEGGSAPLPVPEPLSQEAFARAFGTIVRSLNERGGRGKYELRVANALWGQKEYKFLAPFIKVVEDHYRGRLERVDFVQAAEKARQTINGWVEKQTNGKIKDLLGPGVLDRMTRLVLTNAVYFKGDWASQFRKDRTEDGPFTLLDGGKVQVPLMNQQATFGYGETDTLQALEMPYAGGELSMVILLPKQRGGLGAVEKTLTEENVSKWLSGLRKQEVIITIPRFKMTHKLNMGAVLQSMGMTDAFSGQADFSGMTGRQDLFLSAVVHQAYVDVNEEGTEAAAATGAVMSLVSMAPARIPEFRADHPFLFLIRDLPTGSLLFLGRVMNPQS